MPKRCGHLSGKEVVSPEEMVKKIIAAKQAARTICNHSKDRCHGSGGS